MDIRNEKNHIFNTKLAKIIGLYQILDPGTVKNQGRNVYQIIMANVLLTLFVISLTLCVSILYYWTVDLPLSIDYTWKLENSLYVVFKMWLIVHHSDDIWNCLSITRYDFTSFGNRNRHILDRWRYRVVLYTALYAIIYISSTMIFIFLPLAFNENKLPVKNHDGSIGYYRHNVMNYYFIVTDETYNAFYYIFYIVEGLNAFLITFSILIFDSLLVSMCFAICCQMQIISNAFESVGYNSYDHNVSLDYIDEKEKPLDHNAVYNELSTIILDHQVVIEKYKNLLALFKRVMLLQIFISSLSVITLCFMFIVSFSNNDTFKDSEVLLKRLALIIPAIFFQYYMTCYLFENLNNQKDSIIFALYSSNWTEMDMRCKKLILLTMKMNSANQNKLRFTNTKTVNLNMFFKTLGDCYTVISFLLNYIQRNVE